jgi:hypothetical protein
MRLKIEISGDSPAQSSGTGLSTDDTLTGAAPENLTSAASIFRDIFICTTRQLSLLAFLTFKQMDAQTSRQTDSHEANSHFLHFANVHENSLVHFLKF